jgi:hypothetical protein
MAYRPETVAEAMADFSTKYTARLIVTCGYSVGEQPGELWCVDIETSTHMIGGPRIPSNSSDEELIDLIVVVLPALMDALDRWESQWPALARAKEAQNADGS